jgi:hypothetical protein
VGSKGKGGGRRRRAKRGVNNEWRFSDGTLGVWSVD